MSPGELFVYLYGVGEKRVAIKENQSIGLYPASLALDAVFPNGGSLTKAVGISLVRMGSISSEVVRLRYPGCVERPLITL